jgi:hypothetical protein
MKKVILITSAALMLVIGCRKTDTEPNIFSLGVDLQKSFTNENVQIFIDEQPLLNTVVATNEQHGLATSIATTNSEGQHTIKVIVNEQIEASQSFTQKGDLYIGVNFDVETDHISIQYSKKPYIY